jgi:hypothetical protein
MTVSEAAKSLEKALKNPNICGKKLLLSESFLTKLDELIALSCTKICKDGGGSPECSIKKCCIKKEINGCWECSGFTSCDKLKDQYIGNIKKIKELGIE